MTPLTPTITLLSLLHSGYTIRRDELSIHQDGNRVIVCRWVDLRGWVREREFAATRAGIGEMCEYVNVPV